MARRRPAGGEEAGREAGRGERAVPASGSGQDAAHGRAPSRDSSRPWLLPAATALWVARPLYPSESAAVQGDGLPAVMFWLVLLVVWFSGAIRQPRFHMRCGWVDLVLLAAVVWHTVSAIWWAGHASPRPAINMLWEWLGFAASFFLIRQLAAGPRECRALMAVACGVAVGLAAFGLYQYWYEMPATRAAYQANPEKALAEAGLSLPPGSPERLMFENRLASVEPTATFALTNSLAGLLAPWIVVFAGLMVPGRATGRKSPDSLGPMETHSGRPNARPEHGRRPASAPRPRSASRGFALGGALACAVVVAACLLLTKSRSAYLATLLGLGMVGWMWRGGSRRLLWRAIAAAILLAAALVAGVCAVGGLDREVLTEARKSLGYRAQYWQSSLAMIADHPALGCGPGNFQDAYKLYKLPDASEEIADPHNFLVEICATAGAPAMLAFVAALVGFFVVVLREPRPTRDQGTPEAIPHDAERPELVYLAAAAGFVLALPLSVISPAPPGLPLFLVAMPCVGWTLASLWNRALEGSHPPALPAVGVAVLLVHLSASGGIGFAGVAGSLWLLMAIGLSSADGWKSRILPKWTAWVALTATGIAALACYATGYRPVLRCQAALERALRHSAEAERHLLEAAHADPWAFQPWNQLAAHAFHVWKTNPQDENALRRFQEYTDQLLARAPLASSLWEDAGDRYFQIHEATKQEQHLRLCETCLRRAVELYPHRASLRARLALALRKAGNLAGYEEERTRALELDQITPHLDKKLSKELREALKRS